MRAYLLAAAMALFTGTPGAYVQTPQAGAASAQTDTGIIANSAIGEVKAIDRASAIVGSRSSISWMFMPPPPPPTRTPSPAEPAAPRCPDGGPPDPPPGPRPTERPEYETVNGSVTFIPPLPSALDAFPNVPPSAILELAPRQITWRVAEDLQAPLST